ncbi:hypothetical protein MSP8886_01395 [Marinomonas spartinae]|uniref:Uncharacterized protein n=1 Tax=Marinomonas spartinae TaxID=1792290 RepID=A0A1A8TB30_9GAMM|nr:hypothetical protein [Marinomonas spartinae]SBS28995.1 hypothetical protein MSP8886_01395 [Marinomonas spartinae]
MDLCVEDVAENNEIQQQNYEAAIKELTVHYMEKMKEKQISPILSSPKSAKEFVEIAKKGGAKRILIKQKVREPSEKQPWKYTTSWKDPQQHI